MLKQNLAIKFLLFFLLSVPSLTVVIGADRYSVASGNWNATSTWSATSGGAPGASAPVAGDNVYIENGHTVTATANAACTSITFTGATGILIVNSSVTITVSGTVTKNKLTGSSSTANISGAGSLTCANIAVGSAANAPAGFIYTLYTHTLTTAISSIAISGNLSINSYTVAALFNWHYRDGVFNLESGTISVGGSVLTSNEGGTNISTLSMATGSQSGTLNLGGATPFILSGTGTNTITLNGTSALVNYNRAGIQTVYSSTYTNLTLSGSGAKTIGATQVDGILSMEGTATSSGSAPTYGANAALQYMGSASQTTGIEFPATFNGTGGVIINNANGLTLNSNRTITTLLTFVTGRISTGTNNLILSSAATVSGAGAGNYIYGNLQKGIATATASKTFEIGDASSYTPVTLQFAGTTNGTGNITAKTTSGDHPNIATSTISASATVNRYWTLTNSGVTGFTSYSATFNFVAGDIDSGDYNNFIIGNYNPTTWTYPTIGTRSATSTQSTGMTSFGDFQIGLSLNSYRTRNSGNWNQTNTWQVYNLVGGWANATSTPTSTSNYINIRSGHTVANTTAITVDQFTIDSGGRLNLNVGMTVNDGPGTDFTVNGTLSCGATSNLTGAGSFILNAGGNILIRSVNGIAASGATGNIQTASRSFNIAANYTYIGTASQVTGTGLPATVNNLTIDNSSGVSLTGSVSTNGILTLSAGALSIGSNAITFLTSNTPIVITSGTITTTGLSNISFGNAGNTAGNAFTIPNGTFTSDPVINNLSIFRSSSLTLNDQLLSVGGIVLCNGPLLTNNNLLLLSNASGTALIDGSGTGSVTGNVTMQRYLDSGFGYKYFSSPFQAATVNEFGDDMDLGAAFPSVYSYDESRTSSGWVSYNNPANILNPVEGYTFNFGSVAVPNTVDVTGSVNNGSLSVTLFNNDNTYTKGMNLVGNPYPSPIDWDATSGWTKTNIDDAIYYFKASTTDQYGGTYSSYINGVTSDGSATNIIPSMQGFFVHVTDLTFPVTGTLGMDNSVRVNDLTHPFLKSISKGDQSVLRITATFSDRPESADPAVVYINEMASETYNGALDALKLLNTDFSIPNLYFMTTDSRRLSVNSVPALEIGTITTIPVGLKLNVGGDLVFKLSEIGDDFTGMDIYLSDIFAGTDADLTGGKEYSLLLTPGEYHNRFFLKIGNLTTSIGDNQAGEGLFSVYSSEGILKVIINIDPVTDGRLVIYNLTGNILFSDGIYNSGYHEFNPVLSGGIYIVRFSSKGLSGTKRLFINSR